MTSEKTDLYICVSIHEASSDAKDFGPLFEERLTLIRAGSREEATRKAERLVKAATHQYRNKDGQTISWVCRRIVEVAQIVDSSLGDGAEIYGRYFRDLNAYERFDTERKQSV
jgi:uncharacterized protein DUF4288